MTREFLGGRPINKNRSSSRRNDCHNPSPPLLGKIHLIQNRLKKAPVQRVVGFFYVYFKDRPRLFIPLHPRHNFIKNERTVQYAPIGQERRLLFRNKFRYNHLKSTHQDLGYHLIYAPN
ncbi:hypothetical protein HanRHA438_Chr08g0331621 [Helianthus annuus]|nr:hypothetical protein HanRHA438_Chr08g0331621 [Helianthus annuus]